MEYNYEEDEYDEVIVVKAKVTINKREPLLTDLVALEISTIISCVVAPLGAVIGFGSIIMNHGLCPQDGTHQCYHVTKIKHNSDFGEIVDQKEEYYYIKEESDRFYFFVIRWSTNDDTWT